MNYYFDTYSKRRFIFRHRFGKAFILALAIIDLPKMLLKYRKECQLPNY